MAGTLREGAYSGGSRMAADWPGPAGRAEHEDQDDEEQPVDEAQPVDEDQDDEQPDEPSGGSSRVGAGVASDGAGWVLGVLLWGWVVLPFVKGGPAGVKRVLLAKFFNRAADGGELP